MKKKNITGIITLTSFITLVLLLFIMRSQAELVKSIYIKLSMANLALLVAAAGVYLVDVFYKDASRMMKMITWAFAGLLVILGFLVSFDILPFRKSGNWLMAFGILYLLLIQLQILQWGHRVHQVVRFSSLFIILCNSFLVFFYIAKWQSYKLEMWINMAAFLSVALTVLGLIFLKKKEG